MRLLITCICCCCSLYLTAQELVCNGSFEDKNICTEYNKDCAPEAWIGSSLSFNYYFTQKKLAHQGQRFTGLTAGSIAIASRRNFIRTQLLCRLQKGHQYKLEFYVYSMHPILDSIGVYFSPEDFLYETRSFRELSPQLWSVDGLDSPRQKPQEWQRVHFIYTATGNEQFITIGNFKREDYVGITMPRRGDFGTDFYFFLDDVSFIPADPAERLCEQADSVRTSIYEENDRHQFLMWRIQDAQKARIKHKPLPATLSPRVEPVQHIDTLIIPDIFFTTASYELSPNSYHLLDSFATALGTYAIDSVIMEGHTDSIGRLAYNQQLSENRAMSVKEYISAKLPPVRDIIITRGYAFLRPVATNKTPSGRQQNRRVEIFVYRKE